MRLLSLTLLLAVLFSSHSWATTYSCRDSQGRLYYADNLQRLPEECLGKQKVVKPSTPDNLNYVPPIEDPPGSGIQFQHSVRNAEEELRQKQLQQRQLQDRAKKLVERYQEAAAEKRQAKRSWSYRSRDIIKRSDDEIAAVREEKKEVLDELKDLQMDQEEKAKITEQLSVIE